MSNSQPTPSPARVYQAPPRLRAGDRVRVIAPSGPVQPESLRAGLTRLRAWGLTPCYDRAGLLSRDAYLAGSDERRRDELLAALADDSAAAVWAARGGYGAARLLPWLYDDQINRRPRWLIGFSDCTALHACPAASPSRRLDEPARPCGGRGACHRVYGTCECFPGARRPLFAATRPPVEAYRLICALIMCLVRQLVCWLR